MIIDVVVARYCEDVAWTEQLSPDWRVLVYDKSQGGPRQRLATDPDGPHEAPLWAGSIPLANVGGEGHTYLTHIVTRWDELADTTLFLQGRPFDHVPQLIEHAPVVVEDSPSFYQWGYFLSCTPDGWPHHPGLTELAEMFAVFYPDTPMPKMLTFRPWALFVASRERIQRIPLTTWQRAQQQVQTKPYNCAMERLWGLLLEEQAA